MPGGPGPCGASRSPRNPGPQGSPDCSLPLRSILPGLPNLPKSQARAPSVPLDEKLYRSQVSQSRSLGLSVPLSIPFRVGVAANRQADLETPIGLGPGPLLGASSPPTTVTRSMHKPGESPLPRVPELSSFVSCKLPGMVGGKKSFQLEFVGTWGFRFFTVNFVPSFP